MSVTEEEAKDVWHYVSVRYRSVFMRTVHSLLWYKRFISEAEDKTIILCASEDASDLIWKICEDREIVFWVPFPGAPSPGSGLNFSNFVIDSSWDKDHLTQDQIDWFEWIVMPHVASGAKVFHAP